jgi:hypothetical protein
VSLAQCKQWAAEHGAYVHVGRPAPNSYTWLVCPDLPQERIRAIAAGHADSEAHAWADMWAYISMHRGSLINRIAEARR